MKKNSYFICPRIKQKEISIVYNIKYKTDIVWLDSSFWGYKMRRQFKGLGTVLFCFNLKLFFPEISKCVKFAYYFALYILNIYFGCTVFTRKTLAIAGVFSSGFVLTLLLSGQSGGSQLRKYISNICKYITSVYSMIMSKSHRSLFDTHLHVDRCYSPHKWKKVQ